VRTLFDGKVIAIDVKHPVDDSFTLPPRRSEGVWLEGRKAWRVRDDGSRAAL
jgi:hypothetical protein